MASTRTKNTNGNYCLEQKSYYHSQNYTTYKYSQYGEAYEPKFAGLGLLPGQMPNNNLSENYSDIESFLFGIGSTNLVSPKPCLTPNLKTLESANIYKTEPTYLPEPLIISKSNRPFPVP
jgi:hypothetical protein